MSKNPIQGPFDVAETDLMHLTPNESVELFHQLLVAEAIGTALPISAINVPKAITTADGGIDAEVSFVAGAVMPVGLLREGHVRYQIKTGKFSLTTLGDIKTLFLQPMFHGRPHSFRPEHLNPRVKSCLDANGTFIAVLFGSDLVGTEDGYGINEMRAFLEKIDSKYKSAKVEVLRVNQVCAAIKVVAPALALKLNGLVGNDGAQLRDMDFLRDSCELEVARFVLTDDIEKRIAAISAAATTLEGFRHIRILGDAGSGKTHLVFEALAASPSKGLVVYCADAGELDQSQVFAQLMALSKTARVVLVADECDFDTASVLQARLRRITANFLLITLFNQVASDDALGDVQLIGIPALSDQAMHKIFEGYGIPSDRREWLADLCSASPRAAHKIGQYVSSNPEVEYASHFPKLDSIWEAMVCSPEGRSSTTGLARLTVARAMALFRRISWDGVDKEAGRNHIDAVMHLVDPGMSTALVADSVTALKQRRILQGRTTLYFSPKLLHVKLWCDWWENFGHLINDTWMREKLKGQMRQWFFEMFVYAKESRAATEMVENLLSEDGLLRKLEDFSLPGNAQLFFALAQADSKAALRRLKLTLERANKTERIEFEIGRREVVRGLELLAVPATNFVDAADCLLMLAETENETWSNNATGVFVSLFTLGYDKLAASEMPPSGKISFLRGLIQSENEDRQRLALRALEESLRTFISRMDIGDTMGLRVMPARWMPKNYNELWDGYGRHIDLLAEAYKFLPETMRNVAAKGIIDNTRDILRIPVLSEKIIESLRMFATDISLKKLVVERLIEVLHYDRSNLPEVVAAQLDQLRKDLTENTFHDKLERQVGLQLLEDNFTSDGEYTDQPSPVLFELCAEILAEPKLLTKELPWLVTEEAKNGFQFGVILGSADLRLDLWEMIKLSWLKADADRSDYFLGGYLNGLFSQDTGLWELVIGELFQTPEALQYLLRLVWRSGMSDEVAWELSRLCDDGEIEARSFGILIYGGVVGSIPLEFAKQIVTKLLGGTTPEDADTALSLLQSRIRTHREEISELLGLLERALNHHTFICGSGDKRSLDRLRDHHWSTAAKTLHKKAPDLALEVALKCIDHFGATGSVTDSYRSGALEFMDTIIKQWPYEVWQRIANQIVMPIDRRVFKIFQWLRGYANDGRSESQTGFELMPPQIIVDWVSERADERAWLIAEYAPPVLSFPEEPKTLVRLLLEHFGDNPDVRKSLHANFMTEGFVGQASVHYQARLNKIRVRLQFEKCDFVILWLREEEEKLVSMIHSSLEQEESES